MVCKVGTWKVSGDSAGFGSLRTPNMVGILMVRESNRGCETSYVSGRAERVCVSSMKRGSSRLFAHISLSCIRLRANAVATEQTTGNRYAAQKTT